MECETAKSLEAEPTVGPRVKVPDQESGGKPEQLLVIQYIKYYADALL
jgi:hypothetical protein